MSAHEQMRAMLDQLMGTARNGEADSHGVKFSDDTVCKSFLLQCCPHEILSSTRMDLGECPKIHDLALRADFELASKTKDYFYDIDATDHLEAFIADCDRRTTAAKQRLAETQEELSQEVTEKANAVHELAEQIGQKLARAEALGEEGMVEESVMLMGEIDELRKKKAVAEQEYRNSMPASSYQQQKLRVCEVCSAYLGIHDNDRRLADHFGGKLHLGFITIRDKLWDLKKNVDKRRDERGASERERSGGRRHYVGGRELDRRARRHRESARDRDRNKEERGDRDRAKERERRRSRSRSRSRREESRDETREKSREKTRGNSREKTRGDSREKTRGDSREKTRGDSREKTRDLSREKTRGDSREKTRDESREKPREESREKNRDESREKIRDESREKTRGDSREKTRDESREKIRDEAREKSRGRERDRDRESRRSRSHRSSSRERRRE